MTSLRTRSEPRDAGPRVTVGGSMLRGAVALLLMAAATAWVFTTESDRRPLLSVGARQLTRVDLPAVPLALTGALLLVVAVLGRHARPARSAALWLVAAAVLGWIAVGWLSEEPVEEGRVLAEVSATHGVTESDLAALPVLAAGLLSGLVGAVQALRSLSLPVARPDS